MSDEGQIAVLEAKPVVVQWTLGGVSPEALAVLFGGEVIERKPEVGIEIAFKRPGRAGLTRTQRFMAFKRGKEIPVWVWKMRANRKSRRHGSDVTIVMPRAKVQFEL